MATEDLSRRYQDLELVAEPGRPRGALRRSAYGRRCGAQRSPRNRERSGSGRRRLRAGGRLVYVGAGTSGRIGVQDGAELPPTFNWPDEKVVYLMAGGDDALLRAVENAEDTVEDGVGRIRAANVGEKDVVIGVAASGTTPFTVAALKEATSRGAVTVGVSNNPDTPILSVSTHPILVETGEEIVAGSTRMKAGTAQKVVLNLLSTLIMIRLGRVYRGLMVQMRATNAKLRRRSEIMVTQITGCEEKTARDALSQADGDVKVASLIVFGVDRPLAEVILARSGDNLRTALADVANGPKPAQPEPQDG